MAYSSPAAWNPAERGKVQGGGENIVRSKQKLVIHLTSATFGQLISMPTLCCASPHLLSFPAAVRVISKAKMKALLDNVTLPDLFIGHLFCLNNSALSMGGVFKDLEQ